MSATHEYTAMHAAFERVARENGVRPFCVRVLWALQDRGGVSDTHEMTRDVMLNGSGVRRALTELYAADMVRGYGLAGGPPTRGTVTTLRITDHGRLAVADARRVRDEIAQSFAREVSERLADTIRRDTARAA